jgi:hypothetical protein
MANGKLRLSYNPAAQQDAIPTVSQVYDWASDFAQLLDNLLPEGRLKSLALTNLEQTVLWAQRALESR